MRAVVVFTDESSEHPFAWVLKKGFKHCFVAVDNGEHWIEIDASTGIPTFFFSFSVGSNCFIDPSTCADCIFYWPLSGESLQASERALNLPYKHRQLSHPCLEIDQVS